MKCSVPVIYADIVHIVYISSLLVLLLLAAGYTLCSKFLGAVNADNYCLFLKFVGELNSFRGCIIFGT